MQPRWERCPVLLLTYEIISITAPFIPAEYHGQIQRLLSRTHIIKRFC